MDIIRVMRTHDITPVQIEQILTTLEQRCEDNRVALPSDLPLGVMTVVGTKAAMEEITTSARNDKMLTTPPEERIRVISTDTLEKYGRWVEADSSISKKLNQRLNEPRELYIFKGWVYQLTYNNIRPSNNLPRFSQGQLCVVQEVPQDRDGRVQVRILPPGTRHVPDGFDIAEWPLALVSMRDSFPVIVGTGMQKAKRRQFPLNYNCAVTCHKAMGQTLPSIATRIEDNTHYMLWDRNQLLVILSRVTTLDNVYFIGDWQKTKTALRRLLMLECLLTKMLSEMLSQLDRLGTAQSNNISALRSSKMHFTNCDVPSVDIGFVYLFCSAPNKDVILVGECENLQTKIRELHSPANATGDPHSPYVLLGFFCGFFGDVGTEDNQIGRTRLLELVTNNMDLETCGLLAIRNKILAVLENLRDLEAQDGFDRMEYKHVCFKWCFNLIFPGDRN